MRRLATKYYGAIPANPDLPERFKINAKLNVAEPDTFYSPGPEGYTDYPTMRMS